ncbi:class IIb bacteriocin, lactobin A/cerein 7B family [Sphingobacterium paucimobilis]|nr:class IIb bacteriocin, lactobin A/cerein 7B family [Sphingobacterium paucimobilis]
MMNLKLNDLDVQELDSQEMKMVDGGIWPTVLGGLLLYGIVSAIENPKEFRDGFLGR